jgi:hypothetical protein
MLAVCAWLRALWWLDHWGRAYPMMTSQPGQSIVSLPGFCARQVASAVDCEIVSRFYASTTSA